jgi:chromosome segregation ATPase
MLTHKISLIAAGIVLASSSLCAALAKAQTTQVSQGPTSLAEAARKTREQNKDRQPTKVFTNEDIPDLKGVVSVVGTEPPAPAAETAQAGAEGAEGTKAAAGAAAAAKPEVKDEKYWRGKFAEARKKLADDSKELDVLQREYNLKQQQFYSNPNVAMREQYGRADLNKTRDDIDAKKTDVDKDKQAIADLEDQLRQAGGDPGWSRDTQDK